MRNHIGHLPAVAVHSAVYKILADLLTKRYGFYNFNRNAQFFFFVELFLQCPSRSRS